jgi:hypothetical protein
VPAKILILPFAVGFSVGALFFLAIAGGILLQPLVGPETEFDWSVFVRLVLARIFLLAGIFFTGIAGALWLYIFGRSAWVTYER